MLPVLKKFAKRFGIGLTVGEQCERIAQRFLKQHSYRILARNLRNRFGEVDILAQSPDGRTLVVVEVKGRQLTGASKDSHRPEVHVNHAKQRKLIMLASQIVKRFGFDDQPTRFDVIGIDLSDNGDPSIRHHVNAFQTSF